MISELIVIPLTFFALIMIDKISTVLGFLLCLVLTYFCTLSYFQESSNNRHTDHFTDNTNYLNRYYLLLGRSFNSLIFSSQFSYIVFKTKTLIVFAAKYLKNFLQKANEGSSTEDQSEYPKEPLLSHCGSSVSVDAELKTIVDHILQSYIQSWYFKLSKNKDFIREINYVIEDTLRSFCSSVSTVDKKQFVCHVVKLYTHFFSHFEDAFHSIDCSVANVLEINLSQRTELLQNFKMQHWAMKDCLTEWCYLQSIVGNLLDFFGPIELLSCPLLHTVVIEILTYNVMIPLLNVLSDPNRLNLWLLKLIYLRFEKRGDIILWNIKLNGDNEITEILNSAAQDDHKGHTSLWPKPKILLTEETESRTQGIDMNVSCQNSFIEELLDASRNSSQRLEEVSMDISDISSDLSEYIISDAGESVHQRSPEVSVKKTNKDLIFLPVALKAHSNVNLSVSELEETLNRTRKCADNLDVACMKRSRSADYIQLMPHASNLLPINTQSHSTKLHGRTSRTVSQQNSDFNQTGDIEVAEEAVEKEVPQLFTDVKIIDTQQQVEPGHAPYTLYCIQYIGIFQDITSPESSPTLVKHVVNIRRRFREFLALQSRLEDNPDLRNHLKGIKGPSKWLASPFANLDKKNIAERKSFLESYLKELCNKDAISKSSELQEFLAYGRDASIAFVKKASDINVPRIDKMLFKGVKCAIDMLRTALPNSQLDVGITKELDPDIPQPSLETVNFESKFHEYHVDFSKYEPEMVDHIINYFKQFDENSSTESIYDDWVALERKESTTTKQFNSNSINIKDYEGCSCSGVASALDALNERNPLANAIMDFISEVFPAFRNNRFFDVLKFFCSPFLNSFIEKKLTEISEEHCVGILHAFHKTMWPEGRMPPKISTDKDIIHLSNIIKKEIEESSCFWKYSLVIKALGIPDRVDMLLGSIQHRALNRCFLFYAFDVILQYLCSKER